MNGAIRFRALDHSTYLPAIMPERVGAKRLEAADGVQAPVLFKIPLLRSALLGFGCARPATKGVMNALFRGSIDFGILPGGMEEVALYSRGRERVYLSKRAGFVKYALQQGPWVIASFGRSLITVLSEERKTQILRTALASPPLARARGAGEGGCRLLAAADLHLR